MTTVGVVVSRAGVDVPAGHGLPAAQIRRMQPAFAALDDVDR